MAPMGIQNLTPSHYSQPAENKSVQTASCLVPAFSFTVDQAKSGH